MPKPVVITLTVQAETLYNKVNPTQAEIDACCSLSDNNGGTGSPIEEFTSPVFINNNVRWVGATSDQGWTIAIDSIVYEPDTTDVDFFDSTTISGSGGRSGNVNANVKNDPALIGNHDQYKINFSVYKSPNEHKPFPIDPKLRVNPIAF